MQRLQHKTCDSSRLDLLNSIRNSLEAFVEVTITYRGVVPLFSVSAATRRLLSNIRIVHARTVLPAVLNLVGSRSSSSVKIFG